jgi:hypothetical protein
LGEGLLAQIVDRATDDLQGSPWNQRSIAERIQIAANIAAQYVQTAAAKPLNFSAATPAELAVHRFAQSTGPANGLPRFGNVAAGAHESSRGGNQFSELKSSGTSGLDVSTGPGTGYSWLSPANRNIPGFSQMQVAGAANFLKSAGASREDVNHDTREMVHLTPYRHEIGDLMAEHRDIERRRARGEDVSELERKFVEKRQTTRGHMTPQQQRHFDNLNVIRHHSEKDFDPKNQAAVHGATQQDRVKDLRKLGIESKVEAERRNAVATHASDPSRQEQDRDFLATLTGDNQSAETKSLANASGTSDQGPSKGKTAAVKGLDDVTEQPKKPTLKNNQANGPKAPNPTV